MNDRLTSELTTHFFSSVDFSFISDDEKIDDFYTKLSTDQEKKDILIDSVIDNESALHELLDTNLSGFKDCSNMPLNKIVEVANAAIKFIRAIDKSVVDSYSEEQLIDLWELKQNDL